MSLTAAIVPHLPYLRRFARALTGNQTSGDAYAVATIEAIAEDETGLVGKTDIKLHLFKCFLTIWQSIPANRSSEGDDEGMLTLAGDSTLESLTPLPRVAFLLRAVEGFNTQEIAEMLETTSEDVQQLLDTAGRQIASQLRTEVLIIEDEQVIAMDLEALVEDLGHSVLPIARTHKEAIAVMTKGRPGLVLADIQLADGSSGLDAVNDILKFCEVPVVFITAYPERLLTGNRPEPTFLISKPFRGETVKAIVSQALFFDRRASLSIDVARP